MLEQKDSYYLKKDVATNLHTQFMSYANHK